MKICAVIRVSRLTNTLPQIIRKAGAKSQEVLALVDTGRTCKSVKDFFRVIKSSEFEGGTYLPIDTRIKVEPQEVVSVPKFDLRPMKEGAIE